MMYNFRAIPHKASVLTVKKEDKMGNYEALWKYLRDNCLSTETLTFAEIYRISRVTVDSEFVRRKREAEHYGISVMKINMNNETVLFARNGR